MTCAPVLTACCRPAPPTRLTLTLTLTLTSVLETGTAHPVVIVATTHMHGGLGNLSGQVRLALHTRYCTPPTGLHLNDGYTLLWQVRLAHYPPAPSLGKRNFAVTFGKLWAGQLPYARVVPPPACAT